VTIPLARCFARWNANFGHLAHKFRVEFCGTVGQAPGLRHHSTDLLNVNALWVRPTGLSGALSASGLPAGAAGEPVRAGGSLAGPGGPGRGRAGPDAGAPPCCPPPSRDVVTRFLGWLAAACIGAAILIMIVVSAAGPSMVVIHLDRRLPGPPWWIPAQLSAAAVTIAAWSVAVAGGIGVAAGLGAVARGARPSARLLLGVALAAAAVLTVLPSAGSTDTLDYAAYGRMVVTGRDPYVMTPLQLRQLGDPIGKAAPKTWQHTHSVYGPLATVEQAAAAELGGRSPGRIVFWLKLWNTLAFGAVALALDRLLRSDPGRRARAHLLWSVNPLLLWALVAGGHIDTIAGAVGFAALVVARAARPGEEPGLLRGLACGLLVGAAADIKIPFLLLGVGVVWAVRRSLPAVSGAAAGVLIVILPSYLWFGPPAVAALLHRANSSTSGSMYRFLPHVLGYGPLHGPGVLAVPAFIAVALLLLWRLPDGFPTRPAVRPALAVGLAWLLTWPYQYPWYDAMVMCLIALYPATRLDWPVLARLAAGTLWSITRLPSNMPVSWLSAGMHVLRALVPTVPQLGALTAIIILCVTAAWYAAPRVPGY
jgi:hypothetical protein